MPGAQRAVLFAAILGLPLLAGCTSPEPTERTLLQETVEVGERLYTWNSQDFHGDDEVGIRSTIKYHFVVPGDIGEVGVSFSGQYDWTNISSAVLTIIDPAGNDVLVLNATPGQEDDIGEIQTFWTFDRVIEAYVGEWPFAMRGEGNLGPVDFSMHGIERRQTITQRGFTVEDSGEVTVRVLMTGWGDTPDIFLDHPNGTAEPIETNQYGDEAKLTFEPAPGGYRVRANTTGWGGNIGFQVKQAP